MADVAQIFRDGIRTQVKRVLEAMGEPRILDGITAFETGASSWSACFFARAYPEVALDATSNPEAVIANKLGMPGNLVPMRIVYKTFDGVSPTMGKNDLLDFIRGFLDSKRDPDVQKKIDAVIAGVDYSTADKEPVDFNKCAVVNHEHLSTERSWK